MQRVAVIGGGWTGLSAAARLIDLGFPNVSLLDMGARGPGGRGSSKNIDSTGVMFDYGAQFLDPVAGGEFADEVQQWVLAGVAAPWSVPIRVLNENGRCTSINSVPPGPGFCGVLERWPEFSGQEEVTHFFVGTPSMGTIPLYLASQIEKAGGKIISGAKVDKVRWDESKSLWSISGTSKSSNNVTIDQAFGGFDALIVADALAAIPNSAGYAGLLDIEAHRAPGVGQFAAQMSNLKHEPVFTLMVSFPNDLSIEYDAAVVLGVEAPFQWIARDSSKPGRRTEENWTENWTAITTPHYARQLLQRWPLHVKGVYNPQNTAYREAIAKELCAEFIKFLDIKPSPSAERQSLIEGAVYKAQRWGRAFPVTRLSQDFLARKEEMFIACGDFCEGNQSEKTTATTPSPLESAWQSGRKAAELLASWLGR